MLRGVEEVDELDALGQHAAEERPVVVRSVGNLDQLQVRALTQHRLDLRAHHGLERHLLRLRHPRHTHRREPLSLAVIQRHRGAARLPVPAAPVFIGAITPSSETATVRAVSATSSVSSRTLASNWGVAPPNAPRAPWAVGPASSSRASCCPTHPTPPRPHAAPGERSASRPDAPHAPVQYPSTMPTLRSIAATARSPGRARYSVRIAVTGPTAQR